MLLLHAKLNGCNGIGGIDGMMLCLVSFDQRCKHIQLVSLGAVRGGIHQLLDQRHGRTMVLFRFNGADLHTGLRHTPPIFHIAT